MADTPVFTLAEIADLIGAELVGDPAVQILGLQTLEHATGTEISFLANSKYRNHLQDTQAAAVILDAEAAEDCPCAALITDQPYLAYAKLSHHFAGGQIEPGIHPTAIIADSAEISAMATIGPYVVIGENSVVGERVVIGANTVIGNHCQLGAETRLAANVTLYNKVRIGKRCLIHSSAVIGGDGFGFAQHQGRWQKIAQLGGVRIGDDVEIGASTTVDCGALEDTEIGNGVKIDNQIMIAHNVKVGDDCAFAGCVGIAGSSKIGQRCTLSGGVGISGHIELADDVHITAMGLVTNSIKSSGVYSSGTGLQPVKQWKRNIVRFRQLDELAKRVTALEKLSSSEQDS